jgi:hypothetical protein
MTETKYWSMLNKIALLMALNLLFIDSITGQHNTSSPYSMFGVGNINPAGDIRTSGMGNAGIALPSTSGLNSTNAASFASLDSLTFYMNFQSQSDLTSYTSGSTNQRSFDSNFDQFSFAFKGTRRWGCSLGLNAFSNIGYNIKTQKDLLGTGSEYDAYYKGSGGLTRIYVTNAIRVFKGLSLGANLAYVWGNLTATETSTFDAINGATINNEKKYTLNNVMFETGFQYALQRKKHSFYTGATFSPKVNLFTQYQQVISNNNGTSYVDKTESATDYQLPIRIGGGIGYGYGQALTLALDYKYENWADVENPINYATLNDSHLINFGVEFTPQNNSYRTIFNRIKYRAGAFGGDTYLTVSGKKLRETGFSAGMGIPLKQRKNFLNISYQYRHLGTSKANLIEESHHTIKLGLLLSETWFFKSKFD